MNAGQTVSREAGPFKIVSVDIFDTVMLRCHRSDDGRYHEAAKSQSSALKKIGVDVGADALFAARREVQSLVYRGFYMYSPTSDVGLSKILELQAKLLALGDDAVPALLAGEMAFEEGNLRPNKVLIEALTKLAAQGKRCIAVSDTPLSEEQLGGLLKNVAGPLPLHEVYSSSERGATKHAGTLFDVVAKAEGVDPETIVHFGDNHWSDVVMPRKRGWQAAHLPRPPLVRVRRGMSSLATRYLRAAALR